MDAPVDIHLVGGLGGRSSVCECTPRWMRCASSACLRWTWWMGAVLHLEHCSVHLDPPVDVYLVRSVDSVELGGFGTRWTRWTRWIGVDQVDPPGGPGGSTRWTQVDPPGADPPGWWTRSVGGCGSSGTGTGVNRVRVTGTSYGYELRVRV